MKQIIYIVEDNRMMREFLLTLLSSEYEIHLFESGTEAMEYIDPDKRPDLILLDYELQGQNGLSFLAQIKSNDRLKCIPVIFLSGQQRSDIKIECLQEGANDFISKPFNPMELKIRINKAIVHAMRQEQFIA